MGGRPRLCLHDIVDELFGEMTFDETFPGVAAAAAAVRHATISHHATLYMAHRKAVLTTGALPQPVRTNDVPAHRSCYCTHICLAGYRMALQLSDPYHRLLDFDQMTSAPNAPGGCADNNWCVDDDLPGYCDVRAARRGGSCACVPQEMRRLCPSFPRC